MTEEQSSLSEEFRKHVSPGKDWREIVAWVGDLPPLPQVATRALALIEDPDTNTQQLSKLLGSDTALAARVLKIANSAMFARQREITTISQAVMIIGMKTLKGIIIAASLHQFHRKFGPIEQLIWRNSACCAIGARYLCQILRRPYFEEAFLIGLLHDLGKLILMRQIPDEYQRIVERTQKGLPFFEVEQEQLGFAHPLIGALVAKKWNFSMEICETLLHHHNPVLETIGSPLEEKTTIIQASNFIAHQLGHGNPEGYPDMSEEGRRALAALGFDEAKAVSLVQEIAEQFDTHGSAFL